MSKPSAREVGVVVEKDKLPVLAEKVEGAGAGAPTHSKPLTRPTSAPQKQSPSAVAALGALVPP